MKKLLSLSLLALMCASVFAQQVVLTFTGRDADNHFLPLSRVVISNQTRGWQETIYYPDTTLSFGATGISDYAANGSFGLAQNNPNPFNGTTDVNLTVTEPGAVTMEIADVNGKIVETYGRASLQPGTHQFRLNVANAGVYFLTARQNGKTSSVKMVNNGNGAGNGIEYVGTVGTVCTPVETVCTPVETVCTPSLPTKNGEKGHTDNPFSVGDEMVYIGYAIVNGTEYASQTIHQNQLVSETFVLNFNVAYVEPTGFDGQPCPGTPTLTDVDGNTYNTVQIGEQCWMKENLRTSTNGAGTGNIYTPTTTGYDVETYGRLYDWDAVMQGASSSDSIPSGVQGICPTGWHVPSDAEWTQLTDYVSSQSGYVCGSNNTYIAKALAGTTGWSSSSTTCAVGNTPSSNNATGFSALPAGYYGSSCNYFGFYAYFWSATENSSTGACNHLLGYDYAGVGRGDYNEDFGYSVRCVRD